MTPPRDWLRVGCEESHDWKSVGGANCGCLPEGTCSVPVHVCFRCLDCDYGDNEEADRIRKHCAAIRQEG